jgi:cell division protease FtsH
MEKETLAKDDMIRICDRVVKRPPMAPYNGFGKRTPSDRPPVLTPTEIEQLADVGMRLTKNGHGSATLAEETARPDGEV